MIECALERSMNAFKLVLPANVETEFRPKDVRKRTLGLESYEYKSDELCSRLRKVEREPEPVPPSESTAAEARIVWNDLYFLFWFSRQINQ